MQKLQFFGLLILLGLAACVRPTPSPEPSPSAYPAPTEPAPTPTDYPYPATGDQPASSNEDQPTAVPVENPYAPAPGDDALLRGVVYPELGDSSLLILESFPVQVILNLSGATPNPCYHPRVVIQPPDAQNRIFVEVYSVASQDSVCTEALNPFTIAIPLGAFREGKFSVYVNDEFFQDFQP